MRLSAIPALSPKWNSRCNPGPQSARGGCGHLAERIGELLEVGEGYLVERLPCPPLKPVDVGPIGALGVDGSAMEPEFQQLIVGARAGGIRYAS